MGATWDVGYDALGLPSYDFTTVEAAKLSASVSPYDLLRLHFSNPTQCTAWPVIQFTSKPLSLQAAITTGQQVSAKQVIYQLQLTADVTVEGLALNGQAYSISLDADAGSSGTVFVDRCILLEEARCFDANGARIVFRSCKALTPYTRGFRNYTATQANMVCINCSCESADQIAFSSCETWNCYAASANWGGGIGAFFSCTGDYNASGDATAPGANSIHNLTHENAGFYSNTIANFNRLRYDSTLIGSGDDSVADYLSTDLYGNTYPADTIGCDAGVFISTDRDSVLTTDDGNWAKADRTKVQEGNDFGVSGSEVAALSNTTILDTVSGGRWQAADSAKYEDGQQYGIDGTSETGSFVCPAENPDAPTITDETPGDGQVTLSVTTVNPTDEVVAFWRQNGEWTSDGDAFTRTGSGDLTVTGLTNGKIYGFVCMVVSGGIYSLPSNEVVSSPTNGFGSLLKAYHYQLSSDSNVTSRLSNYNFGGGEVPAIFTSPRPPEDVETDLILIATASSAIEGTDRGTRGGEFEVDVRVYGRKNDSSQSIEELAFVVWQSLDRAALCLDAYDAPYTFANGPVSIEDPDGYPGYLIRCRTLLREKE